MQMVSSEVVSMVRKWSAARWSAWSGNGQQRGGQHGQEMVSSEVVSMVRKWSAARWSAWSGNGQQRGGTNGHINYCSCLCVCWWERNKTTICLWKHCSPFLKALLLTKFWTSWAHNHVSESELPMRSSYSINKRLWKLLIKQERLWTHVKKH